MAKYVLAIAAFALGITAAFMDWRVTLIMLASWWADNMVKTLWRREHGA